MNRVLISPKEHPTDMSELDALLTKKGIPHILRQHPGAASEPTKEIIGYNPGGDWQIIIEDTYSVIRGAISFGYYEIMNIADGKKFTDPERFDTPEELIDELLSPKKAAEAFTEQVRREYDHGIETALLNELEAEIETMKIAHADNCYFGQGEGTASCICTANCHNVAVDDVLAVIRRRKEKQ